MKVSKLGGGGGLGGEKQISTENKASHMAKARKGPWAVLTRCHLTPSEATVVVGRKAGLLGR